MNSLWLGARSEMEDPGLRRHPAVVQPNRLDPLLLGVPALDALLDDPLVQSNIFQVRDHRRVEACPKLVHQDATGSCVRAAAVVMPFGTGVGIIDGPDDVGHRDPLGIAAQRIATAGSSGALHELAMQQSVRSIIATTAYRPLVLKRIGLSLSLVMRNAG